MRIADSASHWSRSLSHSFGAACLAAGILASSAQAQLLHRYSFEGNGTVLTDSVGNADGTIFGGAALTGTGDLQFDGVDDYAELPPNLLNGLADITFEVWSVWDGGPVWQRLFDFGESTGGPGNQGQGLTFIVLTPFDTVNGVPTGAVAATPTPSIKVYANAPAPTGVMIHYVYTYSSTNDEMKLYIDGVLQNTTVVTDDLVTLNDENNWIGKSQWTQDAYFGGSITEFRLHGSVLDDAMVAASFAAGPGGSDQPIGTNYCGPATPNSSGVAAEISATGSTAIPTNDVTLTASDLPAGQFGYFITGQTQGFFNPPGSQGFICLNGSIGRYNQIANIIQGPTGSISIDLTAMPVTPVTAVMPGETWRFQCWFRDNNPSLTSNFTDGIAILFQ